MFCSFFTIPAEGKEKRRRPVAQPNMMRTVITGFLMSVWVLLMALGGVSLMDPPWLQDLAKLGVENESLEYKGYGDAYLLRGEYRLAATQYRRSLEINPEQVAVTINYAVACLELGALDEAARALSAASKLETDRKGLIWYNMAELLDRRGKADQALAYYERAVGTMVEQDLVHRKIAVNHTAAGRLEEAVSSFEQSLAAQTDISAPYRAMLRRTLDVYEGDTIHLPLIEDKLAEGMGAEERERYDLEIIRQTLQRNPEVAKTHNHLGHLLAQLNDRDEAKGHFRQSLAIWPGNQDATRYLAYLERPADQQATSFGK